MRGPPALPRAGRLKLPAAIVGAVLVAEAAVWLLRPDGVLEPATVAESRYFTADQLERARSYVGGQRLLGVGALAAQGAVLALLVWRPPRWWRRLAERSGRGRALVGGAAVGALVALVVEAAPLPFRAAAHERAVDVGLSTQDWAAWFGDRGKTAALSVAFGAIGAALLLGLVRRFPRRWWIGAAGAVVAIEVLFVWLAPVVLAPLFNRFEELPSGRARADVLALARKADVDVGEVYVMDASRRTRRTNAFVTGIGSTKRIVLFDTLLEDFDRAELRLVVAHELAHVKNRDVPRGMLWVALVAPAAMFAVKLLGERWARHGADGLGSPASLPALALALAVVSFGGGVVSNQLSRRVEARADTFALEITGQPRSFIAMEQRLVTSNLSDPDPPALFAWLFGTHPPAIERIGTAVAFERRR